MLSRSDADQAIVILKDVSLDVYCDVLPRNNYDSLDTLGFADIGGNDYRTSERKVNISGT